MSVLYGNPDLVELPLTRGRDSQSGFFHTRTWKGTEDACNAGLDELAALADHAEVTGDGGVYTLTARFAGADPTDPQADVPVREERLHCNRVTKSIYEHPNFAGIAANTKDDIRRYIDQGVELPFEITVPNEVALLELLKSGVTDFVIYQVVVIVTDTASASYPWNIGFENVGVVLSLASFLADANLQSGWADNLPDTNDPPAGFAYGYLKGPPEITTVGGNRSQLTQEFEFGLWSTELYDTA